ncbi:MAG: hypothetical protein C0506_10890 [Anaerolinea sp.]|nr:hypothetical protein [Anaerolinea sp.]
MSNRQARREQSRQSRPTRTPGRPSGGSRKTSAPGGGGPDWLSRPFLLGLAALIIVLGVVAGFAVSSSGGGGDEEFVKKLEAGQAAFPKELANGTKVGKDDAPIKLVAYEDFQCPFCLQYTATQEPDLIEQYVKTGEVQIEFRHLTILGTESALAAIAGQCAADQNRFWDYQNKLFLVQAKAGHFKDEKLNVGRFTIEKLKDYAAGLGLDTSRFDKCLDANEHLDVVQDQVRQARQLGITSTPGFVVNGSPMGSGAPADMEGWKKIFETVKAAANATPSATAPAGASPAATTTAAPAPSATATATRAP